MVWKLPLVSEQNRNLGTNWTINALLSCIQALDSKPTPSSPSLWSGGGERQKDTDKEEREKSQLARLKAQRQKIAQKSSRVLFLSHTSAPSLVHTLLALSQYHSKCLRLCSLRCSRYNLNYIKGAYIFSPFIPSFTSCQVPRKWEGDVIKIGKICVPNFSAAHSPLEQFYRSNSGYSFVCVLLRWGARKF